MPRKYGQKPKPLGRPISKEARDAAKWMDGIKGKQDKSANIKRNK